MKKTLFLTIALLTSSSVFAATDHYILRDGNHVQHLKISDVNKEVTVSADVNFEPNADEKDKLPCAAEISGEAKVIDKNNIVLKKHAESGAAYCELKIQLSDTGVKVEQSKDCENFAAGICHFSTDGKELAKVK